jgi:membrane associated rhomboid family serine protease
MSSYFVQRSTSSEEDTPVSGPISGWRAKLAMLAAPRRTLGERIRDAVGTMFGLTAILWGVTLVNLFATAHGLWGIAFAPFLHANFQHLIGNTMGLVLLGGTLILRDEDHFWVVTLFGTLLAGLGTWLIGRPALHIGASGLVFAYFGYLLSIGWYQRKATAVLLSLSVFLLWGGLLLGMLPSLHGAVSWEGHLSGFLSGVLAAKLVGKPKRSWLA